MVACSWALWRSVINLTGNLQLEPHKAQGRMTLRNYESASCQRCICGGYKNTTDPESSESVFLNMYCSEEVVERTHLINLVATSGKRLNPTDVPSGPITVPDVDLTTRLGDASWCLGSCAETEWQTLFADER